MPPRFTPDFAKVMRYELDQVVLRRKAVLGTCGARPESDPDQPTIEDVRSDAHRMDLFGVAFSGGGIRSGTVGLGILQALASLKLLTRVDYLSTVSGGGYIGGWLAAWIRREIEGAAKAGVQEPGKAGVENVQTQLAPHRLAQAEAGRMFGKTRQADHVCDEEPEPIRHLRGYSRYLAPRPGIFSLDSWALLAIYIRNLVINQLFVLPLVVALILVARLLVIPFQYGAALPDPIIYDKAVWVLLPTIPLLIAYALVGRSLASVRAAGQEAGTPPVLMAATASGHKQRLVVLFLLFLAGWFALYLFGRALPDEDRHSRITYFHNLMHSEEGSISHALLGWFAVVVLVLFYLASLWYGKGSSKRWKRPVWWLCYVFVLGIALWGAYYPQTLQCLSQKGEYAGLGPWARSASLYTIIGLAGAGLVRMREFAAGRFAFDRAVWLTFAAGLYGVTFGLLLWVVIWFFNFRVSGWHDAVATLSFGPPLFLLAVVLAGYVEVAVAGTYVEEQEREWRSRMGGYLMAWAVIWAVTAVAIFYVPCLFMGGTVLTALGWAVSAVGTYLARRAPVGDRVGTGGAALQWAAIIAPPLLLIGLVGILSLIVGYFLNNREWPREDLSLWPHVEHRFEASVRPAKGDDGQVIVGELTQPRGPDDRWNPGQPDGPDQPPEPRYVFLKAVDNDRLAGHPKTVLGATVVSLVIAGLFLFTIRVNTFSLHSLYGNRLIRCYLGASQNRKEWPQRGRAGAVDITVITPGGTSAVSAVGQFTYAAGLAVGSVTPNAGPLAGGTVVTITGTNFTGATGVTFGAVPAISFSVDSATTITATAPAGAAGTVGITVTAAGGASPGSVNGRFTYEPGPIVTAVRPATGLPGGGTVVTITGTGFTGATGVMFGTTAATGFVSLSATAIAAIAPAGAAGTIHVTVSAAGGASPPTVNDQFTYQSAPTVAGIDPAAGPAPGGTVVAITGTGFTGAAGVMFGATPATSFTVNSATAITAIAPAGAAGAVDVTITTPGGVSPVTANDQFTYQSAPTVAGINPAAGPTVGGTVVTITGTDFTGATEVMFGTVPATRFMVDSATAITATAPAGTAGVVDVTVTTPAGTSAVLAADQFTYAVVLAIGSLTPNAGPIVGGTVVTISGTGFTGATGVMFGTVPATRFTIDSPTSITAIAPAEAAGTIDVTVTSAGGVSPVTVNGRFTFEGPATVARVNPATGPTVGGTVVTITGTGFTGATGVAFGTVPAASFTVNSATTITATVPKAADWEPPADGPTGAPTGVFPPPRADNEFTQFDHTDDFPLAQLRLKDVPIPTTIEGVGGAIPGEVKLGYYGPYPLFNTTLNLVAGAALSEQDRKGESFVLTPDYCGSARTGYARMELATGDDISAWRHLTVGRAVTISGAAVDPNMPNYQSPPLTALLTVLNLRFGWWIENPNPARTSLPPTGTKPWQATNPKSGSLLLTELAGGTSSDSDYVHLSDGGHFENTGAYELIRRRCRFVVAVDAAEDPNDASENLANLIRLVRTDFGIRIEIDTTPLHKDKDGLSRSHVAVGVIRYDDVDHAGVNGTLVFIRSSLTGDESADLKNYAAANPAFPHHPTADQFFDEARFESYRALGHHIGMDVFGQAAAELARWRESEKAVTGRRPRLDRANRVLFAELRQRWVQVTTAQYERYSQAVSPWNEWEGVMRSDSRLVDLNLDLYPEIAATVAAAPGPVAPVRPDLPLPGFNLPRALWGLAEDVLARGLGRGLAGGDPGATNRVAEYRAMSMLVQMMETAWMQMDLDTTYALPLQRGWMNCFRRWTATPKFQEYWPLLRPHYSWGFVRFCERVLNVTPVAVACVRWSDVPVPVRTEVQNGLANEFGDEWASVLDDTPGQEKDYLSRVVGEAAAVVWERDPKALVWVLTHGPSGNRAQADVGWPGPTGTMPAFPVGVAAVRPWLHDRGGEHRPRGDAYHELFLWVRGGYRTADLGQQALPLLLPIIDRALAPTDSQRRYLMARFPRTGTTAAEGIQRAMWSLFFNDNDFFSYRLEQTVARKEVRLRRRIEKPD